jgi:hypothetical protein
VYKIFFLPLQCTGNFASKGQIIVVQNSYLIWSRGVIVLPLISSTVLTLEKYIIFSFWHVVFVHHLDLEMSTKTCSIIWLVQLIMLLLITKIKLKQMAYEVIILQSCLYILCWPLIELVCQSCGWRPGAYGGDREQCGR